mmetsp:Transcript_9672/g.19745  ORF Transcript_9672/g.19745 Transcript_9672/m.19745 type:complete len:148 (+) Transcript_9672:71-514(+)
MLYSRNRSVVYRADYARSGHRFIVFHRFCGVSGSKRAPMKSSILHVHFKVLIEPFPAACLKMIHPMPILKDDEGGKCADSQCLCKMWKLIRVQFEVLEFAMLRAAVHERATHANAGPTPVCIDLEDRRSSPRGRGISTLTEFLKFLF